MPQKQKVPSVVSAPLAPARPEKLEKHGHTRVDPYYWLNQRDNPEVIDYLKAEKLLRRAVQIMPSDPIVNDHYGDILWKLGKKIQANYFWKNVLTFKD